MRVDATGLLATGGVKLKAGAGSGFDALRKGDMLRTEVVSKNNSGVLTLKMENGHTFNAKLGKEHSQRPPRPDCDQEKVSDHSWWQYQRECEKHINNPLCDTV